MDTSITESSAILAQIDFRTLFESSSGSYLVLTSALFIMAVSNTYLGARMTRRQESLRRHLIDVFPDNPGNAIATGVSNLRAFLMQTFQHRVCDAMAVQKYGIRRPESKGEKFEERSWSLINSSVFGVSGEVAYIIHRVEDVTEFFRLTQPGNEPQRVTEDLRSRIGEMEAESFHRAVHIQEVNG